MTKEASYQIDCAYMRDESLSKFWSGHGPTGPTGSTGPVVFGGFFNFIVNPEVFVLKILK